MKKAHIVCILDNSGSMGSASEHVINSFNTFADDQRAERGAADLTLVTFNVGHKTVYKQVDFGKVRQITEREYSCGGGTAMYDAICDTIKPIRGDHVLVIIQTDGEENRSTRNNAENVKDVILEKRRAGWEFMFMGTEIDVVKAAKRIGLDDCVVEFDKNSKGIEVAYGTMSGRASNFRASLDEVRLFPQAYKK